MESLHTEREEKILEGQRSERKFEESEPVWAQINDDKVCYPATIFKEYPNSPLYDVAYKDRIVKKHAEHLKQRVVPVINLEKQDISDEEKRILWEKWSSVEKERKLDNYLQRKGLVSTENTSGEAPINVEPISNRLPENTPTQQPAATPEHVPDPINVPLRRSKRLKNKKSNF